MLSLSNFIFRERETLSSVKNYNLVVLVLKEKGAFHAVTIRTKRTVFIRDHKNLLDIYGS